MQISDTEVKKIQDAKKLVAEIVEIGDARSQADDQNLIQEVTAKVMEMPDREDRIEELKARIEAGTYNVTSEEIVESMVRRAIADKLA
ncbi:MAG TPA: flagellar biosynthesis anti-sigma factor FlgM [Fimbriimonas sp.]|nr:flagellar biosynthesis anti-sigma factor FlgM [Fimbriimonas sp.]